MKRTSSLNHGSSGGFGHTWHRHGPTENIQRTRRNERSCSGGFPKAQLKSICEKREFGLIGILFKTRKSEREEKRSRKRDGDKEKKRAKEMS